MAAEGTFERVYTVYDYYDTPRSGFADVGGVPHAYRSIWRDDLDDWDPEGRFRLHPVTPEVLALALEDWAIWGRWEEAYRAGRTQDTTHPALPADLPRHAELAPIIERALEFDAASARVAIGEFRAKGIVRRGGRNPRGEMEVRWTPVE